MLFDFRVWIIAACLLVALFAYRRLKKISFSAGDLKSNSTVVVPLIGAIISLGSFTIDYFNPTGTLFADFRPKYKMSPSEEFSFIVQTRACAQVDAFAEKYPLSDYAEQARTWKDRDCAVIAQKSVLEAKAPPALLVQPGIEIVAAQQPAANPPPVKTAQLPPRIAPKPAMSADTIKQKEQLEIVTGIQSELTRLKCYSGPANGIWGDELSDSINNFNIYARRKLALSPDRKVLAALKAETATCPS